MSSIFTRIVDGSIPSYRVGEDEQFLAFLDIQPIIKGHVLVIPKKEVDYIFDIDDKLLSDYICFTKTIAQKMDKVFDCDRIGMTVVGLEVAHAHIHLMPINGIADMDFNKPKLSFSPEEMEEIAASILNA